MTFSCPKTNLEWLEKRTVFAAVHGSHAYGTNRPGSDLDIRGVCVPPAQYFHGYASHFEQAEFKEEDVVVYDIRKFFKLAADCNPNVVEILFTDPRNHLFVHPLLGKMLLDVRGDFITRKAKHTFAGYAVSQLKRIKLHRRWLLSPPAAAPVRVDFDLPDRTLIPGDQLAAVWSRVRSKLEEWDVAMDGLDDASRIDLKDRYAKALAEQEITSDTQWQAAARTLGVSDNFIELMDREKRFQSAQAEWTSYSNWLRNRNPARAALEKKFGYDTKHAMHLVRLLRMGREILEGKGVIVYRPDREELGAIRDGAWTFDQLIEWAGQAELALDASLKTSPLPWGVDQKKLDVVCCQIVEAALENG